LLIAHAGASSLSYNASAATARINFAELVIERFGPADTMPNSARMLMKAKKDAAGPLVIDLPAGTETVSPGFRLTKGTTSPAAVVINGVFAG
jgi:hypothetical protein